MDKWTRRFWGNRPLWCLMLMALALMASYLQPLRLEEGGEISFLSMLVVCIAGYFYGPGLGFLTAFAFGAAKFGLDYRLQLTDMQHTAAELWDYILGYGLLGVSGIFSPDYIRGHRKEEGRRQLKNTLDPDLGDDMRLCFFLAVLARYVESVWNCIYFYYRVDETILQNLLYGLVYCGGYIGVELLFSLVILSLPPVREALNFIKKVATQPFIERYDFF